MQFRSDTRIRRALFGALISLALTLDLVHPAMADNDRPGVRVPLLPTLLPKYKQECAACHVAYPPGMLPVASWQRLMNNLTKHFGTDASLDPASAKQLATWLAANAGTGKRRGEAPPEDRISRSAWFTREHDEVAASTWKLPSVKSSANCVACHTRSEQGDFNERYIRIPR